MRGNITTTERRKLFQLLKAAHSLQRRIYDMAEHFELKNDTAQELCQEAGFELDVTYQKLKYAVELPCSKNQKQP